MTPNTGQMCVCVRACVCVCVIGSNLCFGGGGVRFWQGFPFRPGLGRSNVYHICIGTPISLSHLKQHLFNLFFFSVRACWR